MMTLSIPTKAIFVLGLAVSQNTFGSDCEVTTPSMDDPLGTLSSSAQWGWYGSGELAALVPKNGHWLGMGPSRNYFDKFWWWRDGFNARGIEAQSDLSIEATKLNGSDENFHITDTTSGFGRNWDAMLVGMEFPSAGCWQVTGRYRGRHLQMVFRVGKENS